MRKITGYGFNDEPIYKPSFWYDKLKPFLRYSVFWLLSLTWGLPLTLGGIVFFLISLLTKNIKEVKMVVGRVVVTLERSVGSVSLGGFNFVSKSETRETMWHEIGHSVQNLIWGVFFIPVIGLPSLIRAALWERIVAKNPAADYCSIWFEAQADRFGFNVAAGKML